MCSRERVNGYPTVRFYPGGAAGNGAYSEELPSRAPDYIVGFVHDRLERMARQAERVTHDEL